jgi:hypothetical protein
MRLLRGGVIMNATDVIGWIVDDTYFCPACTPSTDENVIPIFGDSETDSFAHCATCEELIPEVLTAEGIDRVMEDFEEWLEVRYGRPEILAQWAEHLTGAGADEVQDHIIAMVKSSTCHANRANEARWIERLLAAKPWPAYKPWCCDSDDDRVKLANFIAGVRR